MDLESASAEELILALRKTVATAGALGRKTEVADIGIALLGVVEEARAAYVEASHFPQTPRSGEDIGHAFGDIPLCRDCSIEVSLGHPVCGDCGYNRVMDALLRLGLADPNDVEVS